jgi:homoaconitase/3-isopropylmalate dehydratase large subunit
VECDVDIAMAHDHVAHSHIFEAMERPKRVWDREKVVVLLENRRAGRHEAAAKAT